MIDEFRRQFKQSAELKLRLAEELGEVLEQIAGTVIDALRKGGSVFFCGNGGSFSDCHHIVGELVGRYGYDRPPLPAYVLGAGVASMTAIANDYGYDSVFSREAQALVNKGDVLVGLSTSGGSANVVSALRAAKEKGAATIGFAGEQHAAIDEVSDIVLHVPSRSTPRIQECHLAVGHVLCDLIEKALFPRA